MGMDFGTRGLCMWTEWDFFNTYAHQVEVPSDVANLFSKLDLAYFVGSLSHLVIPHALVIPHPLKTLAKCSDMCTCGPAIWINRDPNVILVSPFNP